MRSTLTYAEDAETFNLDHPCDPLLRSIRSWLKKNGFAGITEFLMYILFEILTNW